MRKPMLLLAAGLLLGCGDDDSAVPDASDAPGEESAESGTDDGTTNDEATTPDDALVPDDTVAPDDTVVPDDAAPEILDTPSDDAAEDDAAGTCGPSWHPTACGDCGGHWTGDTCDQGCDPTSCGDGREYLAECDGTTHTCRCSIDGVEVCTCTSANPVDVMGCQPEEWGGANCCWNVG